MRTVTIGGGPAGLYLALLMKRAAPADRVTVLERNRAADTFGWGVVFSDQTLENLQRADPPSCRAIMDNFAHWDDIDIHYRGRRITSSGHGFSGIARRRLLEILQTRACELGVELRFEQEVASLADLQRLGLADADVIVAADGVNSTIRRELASSFQPTLDARSARYIWLGTRLRLDAFTFIFVENEHGVFQVHGYRFDRDHSTFIVECDEASWRAAGLDRMDTAASIAYCERLFAPWLQGEPLLSNATHRSSSPWTRFLRVSNEHWFHGNVVLIGDAAHTAHFSIGSGTKLAMEDAIVLARELSSGAPLPQALQRYQDERMTEALRLQNAARNSMEWFENVKRYTRLAPEQFAYSLLTRSQRVSHENLRLRDRAYLEGVERWFASQAVRAGLGSGDFLSKAKAAAVREPAAEAGSEAEARSEAEAEIRDSGSTSGVAVGAAHAPRSATASAAVSDPAHAQRTASASALRTASAAAFGSARPPLFTPYTLRTLTLVNRIVVAPMDMYSAVDGTPNDFHLVHLGARALGGAALLMTEMTCVSAEGRISPGCTGMYAPEHVAAWRRIVAFVHTHSQAKICLQLGHAGRKGATKLMWEGMDEPLESGAWPLVAPSAMPWSARNAQPRELTRDDMARILDEFVRAARAGIDAGFDMLELHCAHGYLLSSFITPLSNRRTDEYGGPLENRLRYPLEVLMAVRAAWPAPLPISIRISATDWVEGGITGTDAVQVARTFIDAGADIIHVSAGQTTPDAKPVYGRMFQTPFSDRIRNEGGVPTIAVGNITDPDQVNSIIAAGRADLVALARPHLADPQWTLRAAAQLGYHEQHWPPQYLTGKRQMERAFERQREEQANAL